MAEFHEDGFILEVSILSDNSDAEWERYELEVTDIIRKNSVYRPPNIGEKFTCEKKKGVSCCGLWRLDKEEE